MKYRLEFSPAAARELRKLIPKLNKSDRMRLSERIETLAANPHPEGSKKLSGSKDIYRLRTGDYRIAYTVREAKLIVLVLKVGNRMEFYDRIREVEKRAKTLLEGEDSL